jgi:6-phosphogluconate dehydrogenase
VAANAFSNFLLFLNLHVFILSHYSGEAVFARCLSALKDERVEASKHLKGPSILQYTGDKKECIENIRQVCLISVFDYSTKIGLKFTVF